jgi:hypothetical protein
MKRCARFHELQAIWTNSDLKVLSRAHPLVKTEKEGVSTVQLADQPSACLAIWSQSQSNGTAKYPWTTIPGMDLTEPYGPQISRMEFDPS